MKYNLIFLLLFGAVACGGEDKVVAPSDDPADYDVDTSVEYDIEVSEPQWVVPSDGLPASFDIQDSNANVDIVFFEDRLFMAWRTSPYHFANDFVQMLVASSTDGGKTWEYETLIDLDTDVREPRFLELGGKLQLLFFQAGIDLIQFEPKKIWRTKRNKLGKWTDIEVLIDQPEVPWDIKVRNGRGWMSSYLGNHYDITQESTVEVYFKVTDDGDTWSKVDDVPYVYKGGVSETAFEFDTDGSLWIVTRNEDGDDSGFGSHVCWASADALGEWDCPAQCSPLRYDSPELFRHGADIYMVARRNLGAPFGDTGSLVDYSLEPKTTALYQIDKENRAVVHLFDLPGCGDNAFPSIRRTGAHTFLMANYTSPLDAPDITWIEGQSSERGTQIYLMTISFEPKQ